MLESLYKVNVQFKLYIVWVKLSYNTEEKEVARHRLENIKIKYIYLENDNTIQIWP